MKTWWKHAWRLAAACAIAATVAAVGTAGVAVAAPSALPAPRFAIHHDRVLDLSRIERFDGTPGSPAVRRATWLQMAYEMRRSADVPGAFPDPTTLHARATALSREGVVPLAILNALYRPGSEAGVSPGLRRAFAATALRAHTLRGARVAFRLDPSEILTNDPSALRAIAFDPGDGGGFRALALGADIVAHYASIGPRTARVRVTLADGTTLDASFTFQVDALATPAPVDTLHVTAAEPWMGDVGTGLGYVDLAPGHATITRPVVVVEGFDIDNSMGWDELYALLNQENLLETLRSEGFDLVVLDFTDATLPIEENALVLEALLGQVEVEAGPGVQMPVVGASMGGLVARYALAQLENSGTGHQVNTFISFDGPHEGANIPLGIQYWFNFFSGQSADAAYLLGRLNRPAAREMLVYHYTSPATSSGTPDPLRGTMISNLAAVGDWPTLPRRVAISNGSGTGVGQGFAAGAQIIQYSVPLLVRGNVWAVPDGGSAQIFDGYIFLSASQSVTVSGTKPYDNAPGGSRATMTQMDTTAVSPGDIVALYGSHCFIPTVSALAYDTSDLFHDISADADPLAHTPFDAIYYPTTNQEHVAITAENAAWLRAEIEATVASVGPEVAVARPSLGRATPNPFTGGTRIAYTLPAAGHARLEVFGVDGRRVRALASGAMAAGRHEASWDGRDGAGRAVAPGLYFVRLDADGVSASGRLVRVR